MSGERILETEQTIKTPSDIDIVSKSPSRGSNRVDINNLMSEIEKEKTKKKNLVFFGL